MAYGRNHPSFFKEDAMKRQPLFTLLAALVLLLGLGCQITNLFSSEPTPLPPAVRNTAAAPTVSPLGVPTIAQPLVVPTVAPPPLVVASPTLPPVAPTSPPPAQSSTCANPNAAITLPTPDSAVSGLIEIRGTATKPDMDYWKVEYRADVRTNYDVLNRSDQAVTDGVLARLSTKTLSNGVYFIRLVVVQKDGNFGAPCEIRVTVSN
jgi:hypothetical protein